jgi:hypothetical protein
VARPIEPELQPKVREQAAQFRGTARDVVRASWVADLARSVAFSTAVGLFLGFVGAFGTNDVPFLPRMLDFTVIGLGGGLITYGSVALGTRWRGLQKRPLIRRLAIGLAIGTAFGVWVWLVIGFMFMGGLTLMTLLISLGYSLVLSGPMALLSWLVFRPRQPATPPAPPSPKFLERLPVRLRGSEIYAVQAEDHYLRVHTSRGTDLILMRLSDAVAELEGLEGAQTHRSWWVAKAALADVKSGDGRATLKLKDGTEAPVSRTYARALREAGWY